MPDPTRTFDPHRAALLVMDYQNGILDRVADAGFQAVQRVLGNWLQSEPWGWA